MEPNEMVQLGDDDLIDLGQQNEYSGDFEAVLTLRVQLSSRPPLGHSFLIASATMCDTFAALVTAEEQLREELALTKQRLQTALTSSPTTTLPPPARPYSDLVQDLRLKSAPHSTVQCWCCSAPVIVPLALPAATSPTSVLASVLKVPLSPSPPTTPSPVLECPVTQGLLDSSDRDTVESSTSSLTSLGLGYADV
ncbi:unnamed protein product [Tilletia laevis]|uniref:Uncharacterized protein n=3 Tax=Tilletia TaxID=13289 RepID=A0A8X7SRS1_9BASI|nr:hypothetical protein CF336_g8367 [Tilletia laevis]KAE8235364.1 hypothetical protein A4X06_0g9889 [Tilletia controversa]CAD6903520.1 unnamed protein product [Tilletia caries]KAE8185057.1 hypothetical protein CF335_g7837 [Tilletia laevis]CAD6913012.1 unnamed protein product [Tilletia caries]